MIADILKEAQNGLFLERDDALRLLDIPVGSADYYTLLCTANAYSRKAFQGRGVLFAQIGLDQQPCSVNCKFCSLAKDALNGQPPLIKSLDETVVLTRELSVSGIEDLFLMTTAEFPQAQFLEYGRAVRAVLPQGMRMVANVGDFSPEYALALKEAGFTGVYHICRLREGIDTRVHPEQRVHTMDAIRDAGLTLYYCVEPIGPEHTNEELVTEMLRIRDYPVDVMAVMKRICVPGTPLTALGEISAATLAKICAVTVLVARPTRAMCVHEPDELCLMAGANQLYAECGVNPRDTVADTRTGRGFSTADARRLLANAQWES